tara:strand:+ start:197 stop:871 length:675 start_codon:yes stop_codon:yes gene_type:complete
MSSFLSKMLGTNSISQDFSYDPNQINYSPPPASSLGLQAQLNSASMMASSASNMQGQASQMQNMNSGYYGQMQTNMQQQVGDANTSANAGMNRQLSMGGQGGGSLRSLLANVNTSKVGEQVQQGVMNMYGQGQNQASSMMGQAAQAMQGAGSLQAQAASTKGQFMSAMEQNKVNVGMANQAAMNEQQQYTRTSNYNQDAANKAARGEFAGNVMGLAGSIYTGGL